jgi:hypothetical protein
MIDANGSLLTYYDPDQEQGNKRNTRIQPNICYALFKENHVSVVNEATKNSFDQKKPTAFQSLKVSKHYWLPETDAAHKNIAKKLELANRCFLTHCKNEVHSIIEYADKVCKNADWFGFGLGKLDVTIIYGGDMEQLYLWTREFKELDFTHICKDNTITHLYFNNIHNLHITIKHLEF